MSEGRYSKIRAELVAPAGNTQKFHAAIAYGADAVYLSGKRLSLRAKSENFTIAQIDEAIKYAHARSVRVYVLLNVFPHNVHLREMHEQLEQLAGLKPDAFVVSDVGAFELVRETAPAIPVHISTQANVTNWRTARFWERLGASRLILARELSLKEIADIADRVDIDVEIFVHGAMCMAYSGRCFMSRHFVGRDANLGDCAQPCRWSYNLVEQTRPLDKFEVEEDPEGTLIFSSRDLCMINHLPKVISAGVRALKIEGRMKSVYYLGITTRAYRRALDSFYSSPESWSANPVWLEELQKTSNRDFTTGFYLDEMQAGLTPAGGARRRSTYSFVGIVTEAGTNGAKVEARGRVGRGEMLECVQPNGNDFRFEVGPITDDAGISLEAAQPNSVIHLAGLEAQAFSLLRKISA